MILLDCWRCTWCGMVVESGDRSPRCPACDSPMEPVRRLDLEDDEP